jgi:hypothetical protein
MNNLFNTQPPTQPFAQPQTQPFAQPPTQPPTQPFAQPSKIHQKITKTPKNKLNIFNKHPSNRLLDYVSAKINK